MRDVITGVGVWAVGLLAAVAAVALLCLLFRSYYIVALLFLGHVLGFVLCKRALLPWLISPYRFYGGLMYWGAASFVPPSFVMQFALTYACLYVYYFVMYSVLARLYLRMNCNGKTISPRELTHFVAKAATLSTTLTGCSKAMGPVKSFLAFGPVADLEYADDLITGVLSALIATPLVSSLIYYTYWKQIRTAGCSG